MQNYIMNKIKNDLYIYSLGFENNMDYFLIKDFLINFFYIKLFN